MKTNLCCFLFLLFAGWLGRVHPVHGVVPTGDEFAEINEFFNEAFLFPENRTVPPGLEILYEDVADGIVRGHSWRGGPFTLGDRTFSHGIQFNSTKHLWVRPGGPGDRFRAVVGLDDNDDTRRGAGKGQGSVTFQVLVDGKEVFASPVMRLSDPPLTVDVDLQGASRFEIRVGDAGDGRGWDQAVWAEAEVRLRNGSTVRLQDLPIVRTGGNPYCFSFDYDGRPVQTLLAKWEKRIEEKKLPDGRVRSRIVYSDPATRLAVRVEAVRYEDFPAVEWVVYLQNDGEGKSPILDSIQALDTSLGVRGKVLHWAKGAVASFDDFRPERESVGKGAFAEFQPGGGRSSNRVLPFFNLEGTEEGFIIGVGWTGEWRAEFSADSDRNVSAKVGMAHTHLSLLPGEGIRTPRILLMAYRGGRWRGQNLLRRFILKHHRPRKNGKPLVSPITNGNWGGTPAVIHLDNIDKITRHRLPIEYYWIDAEWFGNGPWVTNVGSWVPKPDLYPDGFKPISDKLRGSDRELLLWFEPERVYRGTLWYEQHPQWLLGHGQEHALWNLADPEACRFLTDFISEKITEFGLGCYRQDFNIEPLGYWKAADAPDRQGMTEIRYIEGLYAFWDELLRRHPGLIIDNCASGGRRIDLETIGRATPFWRTDGPRDPIAHQCHTYGLLPWVPFSATSQDRAGDDYEFRSSMCSSLCLNWWVSGDKPAAKIPENFPFEWARKTLEQYLEYRDLFDGDFYPLTSYSQEPDQWMVYQLDRPEKGKGMVVALKRPASRYLKARFPLNGLGSGETFEVTDLDTGETTVYSREDLKRDGLEVTLPEAPDSSILLYRKR